VEVHRQLLPNSFVPRRGIFKRQLLDVGPHAQCRSSEDLLDRAVSLIFQNSWPNSSSAHAAEHRRHRCYLKIADNCSQRPTNATALQLQPFNRCTLANTIFL
jgi:hypothetical protein